LTLHPDRRAWLNESNFLFHFDLSMQQRHPFVTCASQRHLMDERRRKVKPMRPMTDGILESSLYVDDLHRSIQFYQDIFGFAVIKDFSGRGCALQAGARQVLLLFKKGASRAISAPHDGDGELHLAFAIATPALAQWEAWLKEKNIAIEERMKWEGGGESLYFRDPDRHLLEVVTPGTWSIY
jgi:catechol 2,3-dioxygenase-like lactoylglutathione lyase family enzyme